MKDKKFGFGTLYVVGTPIGNLGDMTARGLEVLSSVDLILAEDTRVSGKLLAHFGIKTKMDSYHHHSSDDKKLKILKNLIDGNSIALVTDAGTPGVSDPGNELVDWLLDKEPKISIVPIPGASSLTSVLSIAGFRTNRFIFLGFLPKKGIANHFLEMKEIDMTFVFFESPRRLIATLNELEGILGVDTRVLVARELTKLYEEVYRGQLSEVILEIKKSDPRGEVVVVVEGKKS